MWSDPDTHTRAVLIAELVTFNTSSCTTSASVSSSSNLDIVPPITLLMRLSKKMTFSPGATSYYANQPISICLFAWVELNGHLLLTSLDLEACILPGSQIVGQRPSCPEHPLTSRLGSWPIETRCLETRRHNILRLGKVPLVCLLLLPSPLSSPERK